MLKETLCSYNFTKNLNIDPMFSKAKELKIQELNIILNKINEKNFKDYNDLTPKFFRNEKLYLIPETNINYIGPIPSYTNLSKLNVFEHDYFVINPFIIKGSAYDDHRRDRTPSEKFDRFLDVITGFCTSDKRNIEYKLHKLLGSTLRGRDNIYNFYIAVQVTDIILEIESYNKNIPNAKINTILLKSSEHFKKVYKDGVIHYGSGFNIVWRDDYV